MKELFITLGAALAGWIIIEVVKIVATKKMSALTVEEQAKLIELSSQADHIVESIDDIETHLVRLKDHQDMMAHRIDKIYEVIIRNNNLRME